MHIVGSLLTCGVPNRVGRGRPAVEEWSCSANYRAEHQARGSKTEPRFLTLEEGDSVVSPRSQMRACVKAALGCKTASFMGAGARCPQSYSPAPEISPAAWGSF